MCVCVRTLGSGMAHFLMSGRIKCLHTHTQADWERCINTCICVYTCAYCKSLNSTDITNKQISTIETNEKLNK